MNDGYRDLSVVLVTHNSHECVADALSAVRDHLPGAEIVVVDNGSSDATPVELARFTGIRVLALGENVGFARACNSGAGAAGGSHLLFLNPDVSLSASDETELRRLFSIRPFGQVAAHLGSGEPNSRPEPQVFPERHWVWDFLKHTLGHLRPREWCRTRIAAGDKVRWAGGAALLVARDEFERVGGFDSRFFLYYEDRELSARYRDAGLPVGATAALVGTHTRQGSSSSDGLPVQVMAWAFLGWLEYMALREGEATAQRAARAAFTLLRVLAVVMRLTSRTGLSRRLRRKSSELNGLLALVTEADSWPSGEAGYFPAARRVLGGERPTEELTGASV